MKRIITTLLFVLTLSTLMAAEKPRLVVQIVVSSMRAGDIERYAENYTEGGFKRLLGEGLDMIPRILRELTDEGRAVPLWGQILSLAVILSVSQHISLSTADIRGGFTALPLYGALILVLTAVCGLLGQSAMDAVSSALRLFSGYMTALLTVALVASLLQLILALPVWLIRLLTGRA